ncbi:MAG: PadR family transcriptional regulator [Thaumarchaeota archaeon]|nr:PadR family transcriptional regulator [Nitrososphaerota archaeon]
MAAPSSRHWKHPQAIPRGFLRVYILTALSRSPMTGYDIMQRIEEKTEGVWRPGPGTIYPLLKSLVREKLVTHSQRSKKTSRIAYTITDAGRGELLAMRAEMASFGGKERAVMRLVSDLMEGRTLVTLFLNRSRDGAEFLRSKILELPEPERTAALRDLRTITENQMDWINANLEKRLVAPARAKAVR